MARYIDADTAMNGILVAANEIDGLPTADVVEVVRCKDCEHYDKYHNCLIHSEEPDIGISGHYVHMEENDFCSYGEKKEMGISERIKELE